MLPVDIYIVNLPALLASVFFGQSVDTYVVFKHGRLVYCRKETSSKDVEQAGLPRCAVAE